jgi:hypothetical protein
VASWQQMGTWTTSTVNPQGPSTALTTMPAQPGSGGIFTYRASSPNGWAYLAEFDVVFDDPGFPVLYPVPHKCYVNFNRLTKNFTLMSDATGGWGPDIQQTAIGTNTTIQNSQCTVNAGQSQTQVVDANTLELDLAVTLRVALWGGTGAGWLGVGTYAISAPGTTITTNPAGQTITVDSVGYPSPHTFGWTAGRPRRG